MLLTNYKIWEEIRNTRIVKKDKMVRKRKSARELGKRVAKAFHKECGNEVNVQYAPVE